MDLIDWTCDTCHQRTNGSGAIHIPYADILAAESDRKAVADGSSSGSFMTATVADALALPNLGLWKVECNSCAGTCEGSYWIDLRQVRTRADLERWTEHLRSKTWINASNWSALVASVGTAQPIRSTA